MESVGSIIMYLIIALSIVIFSVLTVTTRKILRSATFLLFTLFATAALYFQLDYEFLGAVQIAPKHNAIQRYPYTKPVIRILHQIKQCFSCT